MLTSHPLRQQVVQEMHLRPMPPVTPPCRMVQVLRLVEQGERKAERAHAATLPARPGSSDDRARYVAGVTPQGIAYAWERHSEASNATLILPGLEPLDGEDAAMTWLESFPGKVMRAVRIGIARDEAEAAPLIAEAAMKERETVSCAFGAARIWSDFRMREDDGYGRLIIVAGDTHPADLGRLVQQVQELGNYRNLALMGLPVAQAEASAVTAIENALVEVTQRMGGPGDDRALLGELIELAAQAASLRAAVAFRMSATAAYGQIVEERLASLAPEKVPGYQSLGEFTERRLLPALRTCASFTRRLELASERIEEATAMLRTRVDLALEDQNGKVLQSMERSAARQLRLQKVVERLSIFAVAYYAVGLLAYLLKSLAPVLPVKYETAVAIIVLPVIVALWMFLSWRTRQDDADSG